MPGPMTENTALVRAHYPPSRGALALRGSLAPLAWVESTPPMRVDGAIAIWEIPIPPGATAEVKLVRHDGAWAFGRNVVLAGGDDVLLTPSFEADRGFLEPWHHFETPAGPLEVRMY